MSTSFTHAFLEQPSNRGLRLEERLVAAECDRRGIPCTRYTAKDIHRRRLPLTRDTFICGDLVAMHGAMKQLGIDVVVPNDFPACLAPYLHRRVWKSSIRKLAASFTDGTARPVFAKPAGRRKIFRTRFFR